MREHTHAPGPWKWERFKSGDKWQCILRSTRPASECYAHDTMVIPMREDCAAFHYAGTLPNHKLLEAAPDLLKALNDLVNDLDNRALRRYLQHDVVLNAKQALKKANGEA